MKVIDAFCTISNQIKMPFSTQIFKNKYTASSIGWFFFIQGFLKQNIVNSV